MMETMSNVRFICTICGSDETRPGDDFCVIISADCEFYETTCPSCGLLTSRAVESETARLILAAGARLDGGFPC